MVTTADKYILNLHRIPSSNSHVKPVIMVHGLGASGTSFLITGPGTPRANSIGNSIFVFLNHVHSKSKFFVTCKHLNW